MRERADTILVVDDNGANRKLVRDALGDKGYRVVTASDGHEGLDAFEKHRPDCVLLDISMPGMDGFAVCERIRAHADGAETPILFLTAQRDTHTFERARRVGGDDFLSKPIHPTELIVRVERALALRNANATLRQNLDLLKKQPDDLVRLHVQRERLMTFVVHDLKNPVHTITLSAQFLAHEAMSPKGRDCATAIGSAVRRLNHMILNLLDISKADESRLAPRRSDVDVRALVDELLSDLGAEAERAQVRLRSSIFVDSMNVDADLFRRVLTNLVENAIRYAPPRTEITVAAMRVPDGTQVRVADAGKGIPPDEREQVFEPFAQGDRFGASRNRGLGLTFCKTTVEAHGGRIWIEDGSPGTVFCVSIPDAPALSADGK